MRRERSDFRLLRNDVKFERSSIFASLLEGGLFLSMVSVSTMLGLFSFRRTGFRTASLGVFTMLALATGLHGQGSLLVDRLPEQSMPGLRSLLETAMTDSSSMRIRDLVEENYEGRRMVSDSAKQFKLSGRASYRKEEDVEKDDSEIRDRVYYSLTLSKALYHWGALKASKQKGELYLRMEELSTFESYRKLALDVRRRYMNALIARKDIELSKNSLELYRKQLEVEQKRLESGSASSVQVYDLGLRVDGAELDLLKKENTLRGEIETLARVIGTDVEIVQQSLTVDIPKREGLDESMIQGLAQWFDDGVARSASIERSSKGIEVYEKDVRIANQRLKPKIGLAIGLTQYDLDDRGARRAEEIFYGGISITWSFFDGQATRGAKRSAIAKLEQTKAEFEQAKSNYRFNLEQTQKELDLNTRILERDEVALERAREHVANITQDFEAGRVTFSVFGRIEQSLLTQEIRTYRSRANYMNSLAEMASLLGFDPFAQKFIDSRRESIK